MTTGSRSNSEERKTILVVDDEHPIREMLKSILEIEGYLVFTAKDGEEGIQILQNRPLPSLILLDMVMPRMNGPEFLSQLQKSPHTATLPVVLVSASGEAAGPVDGRPQVQKPFHLDTLLSTIKRHCP